MNDPIGIDNEYSIINVLAKMAVFREYRHYLLIHFI